MKPDVAPIMPVEPGPNSIVGKTARGTRRRPPNKRDHAKQQLKIDGHSVYIGMDIHGGSIVEFTIELHKEGAPLRGAAHVIAKQGSFLLQYGAPLSVVCDALRSMFFEPAGEVTGHETITHARSLFDLVAQVLEYEDAALLRARKDDHGRR